MRRRLLVLVVVVLAVLAVLVVVGCGGGRSTPPDAQLPPVTYALDPTFGVDGQLAFAHPESREAREVTLIATGAGQFTLGTIITDDGVALAMCRITSTGVLDTTFGTAGCVLHPFLPACLECVTTDGTDLFIAGRARYNDPVSGPAILRVRGDDGSVDTTYGIQGALELEAPAPGIGTVSSLRRLADGSLLAIGAVASNGSGTWAQRVVDDAAQPAIELPSPKIVPAIDGNLLMFQTYKARPDACPPGGCNQGEVCRYEQCTIALASCQPGAAPCPPRHSCDEETNECLPSTIAPAGTDVTRLAPDLTAITTARQPHALNGHPSPLAEGRTLVSVADSFMGPASWVLTPEGTRDRKFGGTDDGFAYLPEARAIGARPDGGFVLAGAGFFAMLFELSRNGTELTRFALPVEGQSISELHVIDDAHLLAVGHHGRHVVVLRLIRTVTPR